MSLRALWLLETPRAFPGQPRRNGKGSIIYTRKFPLTEVRCKERDDYVEIPEDNVILLHSILNEVGGNPHNKLVNSHDRCNKMDEKPIFKIHIGNNKYLYPVIIIEQSGILFCCLCHIEQKGAMICVMDIPAISQVFSFIRCLTDYFRVSSAPEFQSRLDDLPAFINEAAPFGTLRDRNCESILAKLTDQTSVLPKSIKTKQPAWKPLLHKNKSSISLSISEYIQATQCDEDNSKDILEVYGVITCRAELDGATPDITFNISYINEGMVAPIDNLITHHCVQSTDFTRLSSDTGNIRPTPKKIRFIPPYEGFALCQYTVSNIQELPIFGVYNMKMDQNTANLSVNLQLSDQVRNNFEYAELQVPFLERGSIIILESNVSQGSLTLSPDKHIIVWNIGQKFPSKTLYVTLTATVQFSDKDLLTETGMSKIKLQKNYCQLYFKISDFTYSGCYVDPKSVQVSPSVKFKLTAKREFLSSSYKIWNTKS